MKKIQFDNYKVEELEDLDKFILKINLECEQNEKALIKYITKNIDELFNICKKFIETDNKKFIPTLKKVKIAGEIVQQFNNYFSLESEDVQVKDKKKD